MTIKQVPNAEEDNLWIFGFGSLVHNPGFEHIDRVVGYIQGWRRVFYQGSTDHRGTPEAPGRTVTIIPDLQAVTWGAAFKLAGDAEQRQKTIQYLEWREKQYDLRQRVDVFGKSDPYTPILRNAIVYIATSDTARNPNWLGPAPLDDVALQIAQSHGPSGPNWEYLFKLAEAMREMEVADEELFLLESKVKVQLAALSEKAEEEI